MSNDSLGYIPLENWWNVKWRLYIIVILPNKIFNLNKWLLSVLIIKENTLSDPFGSNQDMYFFPDSTFSDSPKCLLNSSAILKLGDWRDGDM